MGMLGNSLYSKLLIETIISSKPEATIQLKGTSFLDWNKNSNKELQFIGFYNYYH